MCPQKKRPELRGYLSKQSELVGGAVAVAGIWVALRSSLFCISFSIFSLVEVLADMHLLF
jgi:hypothetical protein